MLLAWAPPFTFEVLSSLSLCLGFNAGLMERRGIGKRNGRGVRGVGIPLSFTKTKLLVLSFWASESGQWHRRGGEGGEMKPP